MPPTFKKNSLPSLAGIRTWIAHSKQFRVLTLYSTRLIPFDKTQTDLEFSSDKFQGNFFLIGFLDIWEIKWANLKRTSKTYRMWC